LKNQKKIPAPIFNNKKEFSHSGFGIMPLIILSNTTHKKYKKLKLKEKDMSDLNPHHISESAVCNTIYNI
jgi:hypothetical protein